LSGGEEIDRRMVALLETIANPSRYVKRLAVRSGARTLFVAVDDIEWIQAAENYVELRRRLQLAAGHYEYARSNSTLAS
jgi:DNA-binding LytR/AlgR family response regulator